MLIFWSKLRCCPYPNTLIPAHTEKGTPPRNKNTHTHFYIMIVTQFKFHNEFKKLSELNFYEYQWIYDLMKPYILYIVKKEKGDNVRKGTMFNLRDTHYHVTTAAL